MSEGKVCKKCGVWKELEGFHDHDACKDGKIGSCKECINKGIVLRRKLRTPPRMYIEYYLCSGCKECLPVDRFIDARTPNKMIRSNSLCRKCRKEYNRKATNKWYHNNKEKIKNKKKLEHKKDRSGMMKKYYQDNREIEIKRVLKFMYGPARWETFGTRLPIMDEPRDASGVVEVVCKNCEKRFLPTVQQCQNRISAISVIDKGDANFYCSENCKKSCDIFSAKKLPASQRHRRSKARSCQATVKKSLVETQCADKGMVQCEICGDVGSVDLHHTLPVKGYEDKISEAASMMLVCAGCHAEIHRRCK